MTNEKVTIGRKEAAKLIREILIAAAASKAYPPNPFLAVRILELAKGYGIDAAEMCTGEAHENPHIDNCSLCAPAWGWIAPKVVVR